MTPEAERLLLQRDLYRFALQIIAAKETSDPAQTARTALEAFPVQSPHEGSPAATPKPESPS